MKRRILLSSILSIALILPAAVSAQALEVNDTVAQNNSTATYYPGEETTINGVPESDIITTQDVIVTKFVSYVPNYRLRVPEFKKIATFSHDNTRSTTESKQSVTLTKSGSFGSEFSGSISFSGEIKAGIFGGLKNEYSVGYKETRVTNEAVGATSSATVPPKKWGYIEMYYAGTQNGGGLRYYTYNTSNPNNKVYNTVSINAKVYPSDELDIHSKSYSK
ncbi:hypothetical protein NKT34_28985 [Paenibacillus polysaccharolyticus]|uniref:hypothetical protein n=1 Tax=Paenibacillus polysaccharolyticus TaxID=582692 RepID=UPI0020A14311|nr:hypothetical protein [Paenibacillus polysaccharolyticus]MCP1137292.1 hypothetical protein [Paenibacillus polysaccharolyticus]